MVSPPSHPNKRSVPFLTPVTEHDEAWESRACYTCFQGETHADRYIDQPSSCPAAPRRPGRAVRAAPRLSARPCQRADVRGPVHAVARGGAADTCPTCVQALHRRDGALLEF